jgi:hypothetical protein
LVNLKERYHLGDLNVDGSEVKGNTVWKCGLHLFGSEYGTRDSYNKPSGVIKTRNQLSYY